MIEGRRLIEALLVVAGLWLAVRQIPDYAASLYITFYGGVFAGGLDDGQVQMLLVQSIHFVVSVGTGAALFLSRRAIAWAAFPAETSGLAVSARALMAVGLGLMGAYFIVGGAIDLGTHWVRASVLHTINDGLYGFWRGVMSLAFGGAALLFSGLVARAVSGLPAHE